MKNGVKPSNLLAEKVSFLLASFILLMSAPVLATVPKELAKGDTPILSIGLFPVIAEMTGKKQILVEALFSQWQDRLPLQRLSVPDAKPSVE